MMDLNGKSIGEIASDSRVQAAVRQIDKLRDTERLVSTLSIKLALAEHELALMRRDMNEAGK